VTSTHKAHIQANLHWGRARSCQAWSFVCFIAFGNSGHGNSWVQ